MLRGYPWLGAPTEFRSSGRRVGPAQDQQQLERHHSRRGCRASSGEGNDASVPGVQRIGDHPERSSGGQFFRTRPGAISCAARVVNSGRGGRHADQHRDGSGVPWRQGHPDPGRQGPQATPLRKGPLGPGPEFRAGSPPAVAKGSPAASSQTLAPGRRSGRMDPLPLDLENSRNGKRGPHGHRRAETPATRSAFAQPSCQRPARERSDKTDNQPLDTRSGLKVFSQPTADEVIRGLLDRGTVGLPTSAREDRSRAERGRNHRQVQQGCDNHTVSPGARHQPLKCAAR